MEDRWRNVVVEMVDGPATDLEDGTGLRRVLRPSANSPARREGTKADLMMLEWDDESSRG